VQTVLSISQNGINQITVNKQLSNHLNKDIINASTNLPLKEPSPNYLIQSFNLTELSLSPIEFTGSESSIEGFVKIARISTLTIPDSVRTILSRYLHDTRIILAAILDALLIPCDANQYHVFHLLLSIV
jgi:hypothetical protein